MTKIKVNNSVSIKHEDNAELFSRATKNGILSVDNSVAVTAPNINTPFGALTYIRPKAIEILTAPRVADKIAAPQKNGKWGDEIITFLLKEYSGKVKPDDGAAYNGLETKVNYTKENRGVFVFTSHWYSNDQMEAKAAAFRDDYRASQVEAAMRTLAIARNDYFFRGVSNSNLQAKVYGLLNDPSLAAYNTVPAGKGGVTYWSGKEPEEIKNDIVLAVQKLIAQSNGIMSDELPNGKLILAVANGSVGNLAKANAYGLTASSLLKEEYGDKLEIVSVPQFNSADSNSDVFYLIFSTNNIGADTIINSYVEMVKALNGELSSAIFLRDMNGEKPADKPELPKQSIIINNNTLSIEKLKELKDKLES
jgi:hypothetical protein